MAEKSRKPKIRFAGFTEDWEQRKLGEIGKAYSGVGFPDEEQGGTAGIPFFKVSDMNSIGNENELRNANNYVNKSQISRHRWKPITEVPAIFFAKVGAAIMLNRKRLVEITFLLDNNTMAYSFEKGVWEFSFGKSLFETIDLTSLVQVGALPSYNASDVEDIKISLPSLQEQARIGTFFRHLDHLITLHQRRRDRLVNIKKAMLEKMFPKNGADVPEVRFAGFTEAWEQRKWNETVIISTQMVDPRSGDYDNLPHVAPGNIESFSGRLYDNIKLVKDEDLISGKFYFCAGDVVYGKIRPHLGKYFYASFDGLTSADAYVLKAHNGLDQKFLYTILQTNDFFGYSVSVSMRSGMPKINRDELNSYCFLAPQEEEQHKIGSVFFTLDHLITLHQRKVELLQNIKKACLEAMFV